MRPGVLRSTLLLVPLACGSAATMPSSTTSGASVGSEDGASTSAGTTTANGNTAASSDATASSTRDGGDATRGGGDATRGEGSGSSGGESLGSRCEVSAEYIACEREQAELRGTPLYWQVPVGDSPANGWPAVVLFHGSFFTPEGTWEGEPSMPFDGFHQLELQARLLDRGFALFTPTASSGVAWATNFPNYLGSADHELVLALLDAIASGTFGPIDTERLYATGISSGGYMTSRMAVTYPGWFRALAIHSGSYATCTNLLCEVPDPLPADHPPTLFAHGELDVVVPISTMYEYADRLEGQGVVHDEVIDPANGHSWLAQSPEAIVAWFERHDAR